MDELRDTLLCEVSNELEAAMVVNLLNENEVPAHSDASQAGNAFGGLAFESGHKVYVPASLARKALEILESYPHFKKLRNLHEPG
jgi:Putative prokaryotic signal transducing protein